MTGLWSVALRAALRAFAAIGLDSQRICREAGIDARDLEDPDARIPLERGARIWPLAEAEWGLPGLGLEAGANMTFGELQALDYALVNASTLGAAMERWEAYWEVITVGRTGVTVSHDGDRPIITLRGYEQPHLRDYAAAAMARRLVSMGARPAFATVAGAAVAPPEDYVAKLGCPVELGAATTCFVLHEGAHRRALPMRVPGLGNLVDREIRRLVEAARADLDPLARVRHAILRALGPTPPTLESIAARLAISERKLQRLLASEGTHFSAVLDACRRDLAEQLLGGRATSIEEIGYLLGYADPRAFTRAFKRWTGLSPGTFRAGRATSA